MRSRSIRIVGDRGREARRDERLARRLDLRGVGLPPALRAGRRTADGAAVPDR